MSTITDKMELFLGYKTKKQIDCPITVVKDCKWVAVDVLLTSVLDATNKWVSTHTKDVDLDYTLQENERFVDLYVATMEQYYKQENERIANEKRLLSI